MRSDKSHDDLSAERQDGRPRRGRRSPLVQSAPLLTAEREMELAARIKVGDAAAREELILSNLRLALSIASEYRGRDGALDHDDLVQEANIGLMRAARDFDPAAHPARFATYASCWIRHHIQRALAERSTTVRFPYYLVILRRRFEKARAAMVEARRSGAEPGSPDPTPEEVAERMDLSPRRLAYLKRAQVEVRSYSSTSADEDDSHDDALAQSIPPEAPLEVAESMEKLHDSMRKLSPLESWVLRRRYRLDDTAAEAREHAEARSRRRTSPGRPPAQLDGKRTYRELSQEIGRPLHHLRQVELAAIAKLRNLIEPAAEDEAPDVVALKPRKRQAAARRSA